MSGAEISGPDAFRALVEENEAEARARPVRKKRPPPLSIRVSDDERARLKRDASGGSVNAYVRQKLFGASAVSRKSKRQPAADMEALGRVLGALGQSRLASNLNQIAKAANMGALPVTPELEKELHDICADIHAMRCDLLKALGVKPK
ncbi:MAG: hypothetical protein AAFX54_12715 [Pseudomonadota bacterium]